MKYSSIFSTICAASALLLVSNGVFGQAPETGNNNIQDSMSSQQFKASGLEKLSPKELENLNRWLQGYRETTIKTATTRAARTRLDFLVSRVDGEFNGLTGATLIKLEDGTSWRQANSSDHYRASVTDHPGAAVMHGVFGYKMRISGTPEFYVDPVR